MALREPSPEEVGRRVKVILLLSTLNSRTLAKRLNLKSSATVTQLKRGESYVIPRITSIANVCAGEGLLRGARPEDIARFLRMETDDLPIDVLAWETPPDDVRQPSLTVLNFDVLDKAS